MNSSTSGNGALAKLDEDHTALSAKSLARKIFKAELPEEHLRALPAQSLLLILKSNGLDSSQALLECASSEQYQLLLDFELWTGDRFKEEQFWSWVAVCEQDSSLKALQKMLACMDLKLVGLMLSRYVQFEIFEEPTDEPPGPLYYTPDKGLTWIQISIENADQHRQLAKLLALIFEADADLFYRLLATTTMTTPAELEEESYSDRNKRLVVVGIPEPDFAHELHSRLKPSAALSQLKGAHTETCVPSDIPVIQPLVYDGDMPEPLRSFAHELASSASQEDFETELTLLMNAAFVYWRIDFEDYEQIEIVAARVRGILNVGLQQIYETQSDASRHIYTTLGLRGIYRVGLDVLYGLHDLGKKVASQIIADLDPSGPEFSIIAGVRDEFPVLPDFFQSCGSYTLDAEGKLKGGFKAYTCLAEIHAVRDFVDSLIRKRL